MKIIALGNARINSKRLHNKMLKPFANTTLTQIAVRRLTELKEIDDIYFAVYENELVTLAQKYLPSDSIIVRTKTSANADYPITRVHDYLAMIDFDYCVWINSCHAMLKPETIDLAALTLKNNNYKSLTSVKKRLSWFYDIHGLPINNLDPIDQIQSNKSNPIYEVAHAFHIFNKKHFFNTDTYWNNNYNDPYLFEISEIESVDVDTEHDFIVSEILYELFNRKK